MNMESIRAGGLIHVTCIVYGLSLHLCMICKGSDEVV